MKTKEKLVKSTHHEISLAIVGFELMSFFQYSCVSITMFVANALSLASPLNANSFSGFPAGILYNLNHSVVA